MALACNCDSVLGAKQHKIFIPWHSNLWHTMSYSLQLQFSISLSNLFNVHRKVFRACIYLCWTYVFSVKLLVLIICVRFLDAGTSMADPLWYTATQTTLDGKPSFLFNLSPSKYSFSLANTLFINYSIERAQYIQYHYVPLGKRSEKSAQQKSSVK